MTTGSFGGTSAGPTYLREMLYVDTGRVRSYLNFSGQEETAAGELVRAAYGENRRG